MMLVTMPFIDRIGFEKAEVIGYATMVVAFLLIFLAFARTGTTSPAARWGSAAPSQSAR